MIAAAVRHGLAALREPTRARRIAQVLWIAWAIVVWNVVFDHVIVVAGREYLTAAVLAAQGPGPYARMDEWMRPAVTRGLWTATAAAAAVLLVGLVGIRYGRPPDRLRQGYGASAEASAEAEGGRYDSLVHGPAKAGHYNREHYDRVQP